MGADDGRERVRDQRVHARAVRGPAALGRVGAWVGKPLGNGEARVHTHTFKGSIALTDMGFQGAGGGGDGYPAASGTVTFKGTTASASAGTPTVQLLLCQNVGFSATQPRPAFRNTSTCSSDQQLRSAEASDWITRR